MKRTSIIYQSLALLMLCTNIIVFFTFIYLFLEAVNIGKIVEHQGAPQLGIYWIDQLTRTLYFSAITLFSVGYGDITPVGWSRLVAIIEATVGYILPAVITVQYLSFFPTTINRFIKNTSFNKNENKKE